MYVISTLLDTLAERTLLHTDVFPFVKQVAVAAGLDFEAIDLRHALFAFAPAALFLTVYSRRLFIILFFPAPASDICLPFSPQSSPPPSLSVRAPSFSSSSSSSSSLSQARPKD